MSLKLGLSDDIADTNVLGFRDDNFFCMLLTKDQACDKVPGEKD
jgi:hypothetical protein